MGALKSVLSVSSLTLLSRISGLLRDVVIFSAFGIGELNSAFLLAFGVPNLFRRLLGEGALTSALVPVFADEYHGKGKEEAFLLLDRVTSRLMVALFFIVSGGILFCGLALWSGWLNFRWQLCFTLSAILLPYMFFICLGALFAAVLNVFGKFLLHASNGIWLNLTMIITFFAGHFVQENWRIYFLCGGVIAGGIIQMLSLWWGLVRLGWKFHFNLGKDERVAEIQRLFFPGMAGAAAIQMNTVLSRTLAYFVNDSAVAILYLTNRLIELPLGLFVTAITTVIFPRLSSLEATHEKFLLREEFQRGLLWTLVIVFPAMVGLLSLDRTILELLFRWGNFTERDMGLVLPVLRVCLLSLPFYALSTYLIRGYHCKKDTRKPMVISLIHFATNTILTLSFMFWLESIGIAFANLFSVIIQAILLSIGLGRFEEFRFKIWTKRFQDVLFASVLMGTIVWLSDSLFGQYFSGKMRDAVSLIVNIPLGVLLYLGMLHFFGKKDNFHDLVTIWKRWIAKKRKSKEIW
ncbi:MAG: murein biosynthesis integral membrane protein MurJ [Puniceicoccales bacterium]|nr:murein biosynthesis integral membrane protein MurJ [Puniceicoccales bacterium]